MENALDLAFARHKRSRYEISALIEFEQPSLLISNVITGNSHPYGIFSFFWILSPNKCPNISKIAFR